MNKISSISFLLVVVGLMGCIQNKVETIEKTILEIEKKFAPDKREAHFEVKVNHQNGKVILVGETSMAEAKKQLLEQIQTDEIIDSIIILPNTDSNNWGLTILPVSNLRSKPTYSSELVSQALAGTPVRVLKHSGNWSLVQTPDRYISWLVSSSIQFMNNDEFDSWKKSKRLLVKIDSTPVFSHPDINSTILSSLYRGSLLVQKDEATSFYKIQLPSGKTGYIAEESIIPFQEWAQGDKISPLQMIELGKIYIGRSYLWGGTSPAAFDCSGFIKTLHWSQGIILARDASLQVRHGEIVTIDKNYSNLLAGDLLFFGFSANDTKHERVTHVGMYIGNKEFIHASGMVKINSFNPNAENYSKERENTLLHVRRISGSIDTEGIQSIKDHLWYY